ncbi:hypothetical protein INR49_028980 [Caranx melampygus]|nr:hypothetical protein INR49_028980 [Caranx melampygus]
MSRYSTAFGNGMRSFTGGLYCLYKGSSSDVEYGYACASPVEFRPQEAMKASIPGEDTLTLVTPDSSAGRIYLSTVKDCSPVMALPRIRANISRFTPLTPRPETLGSRFSSGTSTSSIRIIPVAEALRENFPSILGVARPFMPRSKMKPRTFPSSHLAQTTAMSATGELVILESDKRYAITLLCSTRDW